jgi:YD repeat-containing protein
MRPGSGLYNWECSIYTDGTVNFGFCAAGNTAWEFPQNRTARIHAMWFAADAVRPVEKRVWITKYLTRCTISNAAETAVVGMPYSATLAADDGYALSSIHVYMSGTDVTAETLSGTGITITAVTGPVVIEAVATVGSGITVTYNDGVVTITAAAGVVSYTYDEASGTVTITNIADMSVSYDDESGTVSIG